MLRLSSFTRPCAAALVIAALLVMAPAAHADVITFDGEVQRGETMAQRFSHNDITYEFRLVPVSHGWQIWIGDPTRPELNYVSVATPPFRGINPVRIEGWHFRNASNSGPNQSGPGNVNAPQKIRGFAFTPDAASHRAAARALEILLWPDRSDAGEIQAAGERFRQIAKTEGLLQIEALELGNLTVRERAWIARMAFSVTIDPPN